MNVLARRGLNLTKILSRPIPGRFEEYRFMIEFQGAASAPAVAAALARIRRITDFLAVIGSYPVRRVLAPPAPRVNLHFEARLTEQDFIAAQRLHVGWGPFATRCAAAAILVAAVGLALGSHDAARGSARRRSTCCALDFLQYLPARCGPPREQNFRRAEESRPDLRRHDHRGPPGHAPGRRHLDHPVARLSRVAPRSRPRAGLPGPRRLPHFPAALVRVGCRLRRVPGRCSRGRSGRAHSRRARTRG
ncbi:MAG: hypothetical protein WDO13_16330 [Verrucomicrobiota bacterium]